MFTEPQPQPQQVKVVEQDVSMEVDVDVFAMRGGEEYVHVPARVAHAPLAVVSGSVELSHALG